ncbi:ATP-binding cassette domain-containing protein [Wenyingzhuangia sp. chi5]|uniref:ATP-binding cassette domain-containing protein n=1 Tax=Wenyingzhuangia gilva TaxID=3057677 RepID=A0ABT8VUS9_9FLAO|nr:ATP-binding cassette domain-containing protein [Wenyingzhuangia sp. chi5]MDO3695728.1 ATP-binding cassette domain-containing protein [Wenyingzhuangia sp. chi5]
MQEPIISIQKLHKSYGTKTALNHISIEITKGSVYGLIGQNGAGKTSLIRILNQIIDANSGHIIFKGTPMTSEAVKHIGYLPEERGLYKNMTIEEQALYFGQLKGMTKVNALEQLNYWLDRFDIVDWRKKKIQGLSKGMAQKVQFIITVLHQPDLLILDEPFSGFDPINANLIAKEIKTLAKNGTTVIFSSHRMESVAEMCDALCLIHHGNILLEGSIQSIQKKYVQQVFEVTLNNYQENELTLFLNNADYKTNIIQKEEEEIRFEVINNQKETDQLLHDLLKVGKVISYKQHTPSLQDIFIKTIENA